MSFSTEIVSWGVKVAGKVQQVRRAVTFKLFGAVILDTPVLTGRLRANWRLSEGEPILQTRDVEDKAGSLPLAEAAKVTDASNGDVSLYMSNSLPYAHAIEFDGVSHTKAPEGMVRKNVSRFARLITVEVAK